MKLEDICVQTGLDGLQKGEYTLINQLLGEYVKDPQSGLFVSDFDKCITKDDFGVQCFEEKLGDPEYWQWSTDEFAELLLPQENIPENNVSYWDLLANAIKSETVSDEEKTKAKELLNLSMRLIDLYSRKENWNSADRKNFSTLMQKFDETVLSLEGYFAKFVGNKIFSRLRFFAGKSHGTTKNIAESTIKKGNVKINDDLFSLYKHLKSEGSLGKIITTNHLAFVRKAVHETILNEVFSEDDVKGTLLKGNGTDELILERHIDGEAVLGPRKGQLALQESIINNRKLSLAAGDSPFGDGHMLANTLEHGGINIIPVGKNVDMEKIAHKFEKQILLVLKKTHLTDEEKQRMWYLSNSQFIDSQAT